MVSYLPEIRAGMALLLAFCAMVQDLRNFKIGNRQILVGLLGAAGCMAYEWMHNIPTYFSNGSFFCEIYPAASNHFPVNEQDIIELYFFIQIIAQIINFLFCKEVGCV